MATWGIIPDWVQIDDQGLRDVFMVLPKDHKGLILTNYDSSKLNMGIKTKMNPQQLWEIMNLPVEQDPPER